MLGEMTRAGCINIIRKMIDEEIANGGGLKSLKDRIEKKWPTLLTNPSKIDALTGKMSPDDEAFLVKTLSKGIR